mmetsp:Transcript_16109/g.40393  ORF Transcript_16109/g.40393 Transcript_16109/m.40393 type:complete len:549 (-) Transcript_16109:228-1874(-)|eukprot:jgi/Tetstr1/439030/TSEL_027522.t1
MADAAAPPAEEVSAMTLADSDSQDGSGTISKKAAKKAAAKAEKERMKAERGVVSQQRGQKAAAMTAPEEDDPLADKYGDAPRVQSVAVTGRVWTDVSALSPELKDTTVLLRGRVHTVRGKGKSAFLVLRQQSSTVQCAMFVDDVTVSKGMVKYTSGIPRESIVDVEGSVAVPEAAIQGCSQQVEVMITSVKVISRAAILPFEVTDAARPPSQAAEEGFVAVNQDTRLDNRYIDLRTPANQAIFRLQGATGLLFRESLLGEGFVEIHSPKLQGGASEGGASVFKLEYMGQPGCLAQSPQLYKQMAISADFGRVFEIGPVFRAENSNTHRHLCEFTGLDMEMEIKEHYFEVLDVLDRLFVHMFDGFNQRFGKELQVIGEQYPFEPLQYLRKTLKLTFAEGIQMLTDAGYEIGPYDDLNTEMERTLGKLVKEKYQTDFYFLHRYPLAIRPFYTMPCPDDDNYSNSFDIFIRGEEIISGAQRIHDPELLAERATWWGIPLDSIQSYIDSFKYGCSPHGGAGVGLERVVMLFCGLDNIRKTSLFPRDPKRLAP